MKRFGYTIYVALCLVLILPGCAGSVPQPVAKASATLQALCDLYQSQRPLVVKTRAYLIDHAAEIPPVIWEDLKKIDEVLPALDKGGREICDIAAATSVLNSNAERRDQVGAALVRLVTVGLQLKAQGVI